MPSAPLFYQPLVHARVLATPIGETDVFEAQKVQSELTQKNYKEYGPAMDGILRGFEGMQAQMPGSKTLDVIQFSYDDAGYIANRVATTLRLQPQLFDTASPDQAAEMGAKLVQDAQKELENNPGMRAVGDTLEVAPDITHIMRKHWEGKQPLHAEEAGYLGVSASRELQRSVTPLEPDATHPQLQWIEDATAWKLGMWPGMVSKTVAALGIKADAAEVEKLVDGWRSDMQPIEPKVIEPIASLTALLGEAGIAGTDDAARVAAYQVLQGTPLEGVPAGIAQSIIATNKLPEDKTGYVASRIVETGGTAGNISGLLAELELMKRPPPVQPPGEPPAGGDGPPPPGPPAPTPPPGEEPPKPVEPPDPAPPKPEEPAPVDPPKDKPAPAPEEPAPVGPPAGPPDGEQGPQPQEMSPAEIEAFIQQLEAEAAAQGIPPSQQQPTEAPTEANPEANTGA